MNGYRRDPEDTHPELLTPEYRSTVKRAPAKPLIVLPHTLSEITGPVYGHERMGPLDHDLTRQHDGEPLGERIIVTGRVQDGDESQLDAYSQTCLQRVWRVQHFSWWMTSMLHRFPDEDEIQQRLQRAELDYVTGSTAASTMLAENYTGMPYGS